MCSHFSIQMNCWTYTMYRERRSLFMGVVSQQLHTDGDASVPAKRDDTDVTCYDRWTQQVLDCGRTVRVSIEHLRKNKMGCLSSYPVVSSLVLIVDPVEFLIGAVLHRVLGNPLIRVTAPLGQDPRNHFDRLQVNLKPLPPY